MVQIEAASNGTVEECSEPEAPVFEETFKADVRKECPWFKRVDWGSVAVGFAAIVIPGLVSAVVAHKH